MRRDVGLTVFDRPLPGSSADLGRNVTTLDVSSGTEPPRTGAQSVKAVRSGLLTWLTTFSRAIQAELRSQAPNLEPA
jgi:hypothetical protein